MNTAIGDLLDRAERAGAALLICNDQDRIIKVNKKHEQIYDFADYSTRLTFEQFQWRCIEHKKTTNPMAYQDPTSWINISARSRETCDFSQFIASHRDGRQLLVCFERVRSTPNWWYQARLDITQELKSRFQQNSLLLGPASWEGSFAPLARNSSVRIANVLEAIPTAAGLIMPRGKLVEANQTLLDILAGGDGLIRIDDRVVARAPSEQAEFMRRLTRFFQTEESRTPIAMRISSQETDSPYFISVSSLFDHGRETWGSNHIGVLTVASPSNAPSIDPDMLAEFLGITQAEAKVAVALSEGHTAAFIAKERNVQINTVYAQIKSILEKTGYSGQADIARRVSDIARIFGSPRCRTRTA